MKDRNSFAVERDLMTKEARQWRIINAIKVKSCLLRVMSVSDELG
jgi:hypothetical protein